MVNTFNGIVSQIMADVSNNLKLRTDLNREHVGDAVLQLVPAIVRQYLLAGRQVPMRPFCTSIPRLPVLQADFTQAGLLAEHVYHDPRDEARSFGLPVEQLRACVRLPRLINWGGFIGDDKPAIDYLGPASGMRSLDIYTGNDYLYAAHRRFTGSEAFAWVNDDVAWLFSRTPLPYTDLIGRMVLVDVAEMAEFGRHFDENEAANPWPPDFSDELCKQLTNRYISMYARYSGLMPNEGNTTSK